MRQFFVIVHIFHTMKLILCVLIITTVGVASAGNEVARKKHHHHGLHGLLYHHGVIALVTFLAIKAKIIIAAAVAFTVFVMGAKVWATYKYGNVLFDKGHHEVSYEPHPGPHFGGEYVLPHEYESSAPSYAFEKYHE